MIQQKPAGHVECTSLKPKDACVLDLLIPAGPNRVAKLAEALDLGVCGGNSVILLVGNQGLSLCDKVFGLSHLFSSDSGVSGFVLTAGDLCLRTTLHFVRPLNC